VKVKSILAILAVAALLSTGCVNTGQLESEFAHQQEAISELETLVADHEAAIAVLESQLSDQEVTVATLVTESEELVSFADSATSAIPAALEAMSGAIADASADAQYALDRAEDVAACVNAYMDVIGSWSKNVNSYFEWFYC
jgi:uncharacterized coiled-coil protein SlyX